uniref:Uncharacterized protein n=1 Tax=Arundo donax TaxID=35708 RepID=A0A0A8ZRC3_ARUDO
MAIFLAQLHLVLLPTRPGLPLEGGESEKLRASV